MLITGLLIPLMCVGTLRRALENVDMTTTHTPQVAVKPVSTMMYESEDESGEEYEEVAEDPDQLHSTILSPKLWG